MVNDPGQLPTLNLALVGDSVYELWVREYLCRAGFSKARLQKERVNLVNARAQAAAAQRLAARFTPTEADLFRRGRNTRVGNIPNAASREEYAAATGLETVFGWLWLSGNAARVGELMNVVLA